MPSRQKSPPGSYHHSVQAEENYSSPQAAFFRKSVPSSRKGGSCGKNMKNNNPKKKNIMDKLFANILSKICARQSLKKFTSSILEYFVSFTDDYLHNEQGTLLNQIFSF